MLYAVHTQAEGEQRWRVNVFWDLYLGIKHVKDAQKPLPSDFSLNYKNYNIFCVGLSLLIRMSEGEV